MLADACNGHKSDHLAASEHAQRWAARLAGHRNDLAKIADSPAWLTESTRTLAVGRSTYFHLPVGTPLWQLAGTFADEDPQGIAATL